MDRKEKNRLKAEISEHIDLGNGRYKDYEPAYRPPCRFPHSGRWQAPQVVPWEQPPAWKGTA